VSKVLSNESGTSDGEDRTFAVFGGDRVDVVVHL